MLFRSLPGFKYIIFGLKALIENFVETGSKAHPSKVDIGPVNTMISSNFIDGLRLRFSAQSTANLNPHLFFKGYYAYGFRDNRSKYMGEVEYSFLKREYLPREFPKNSITFNYTYDVMAPTDKFLKTDKDNVFTSLKTTPVDQMNYVRNISLKYEYETYFGLKTQIAIKLTDFTGLDQLHDLPGGVQHGVVAEAHHQGDDQPGRHQHRARQIGRAHV